MTGDAPTRASAQHILVRDLIVSGHLGVTDAEQARSQRVRINVDLAVAPQRPIHDDAANVVDYRDIVPGIRALVRDHRPRLLETLADRIAELCLADHRALTARVRVEKLDLYPDTGAVGVEVKHRRDGT